MIATREFAFIINFQSVYSRTVHRSRWLIQSYITAITVKSSKALIGEGWSVHVISAVRKQLIKHLMVTRNRDSRDHFFLLNDPVSFQLSKRSQWALSPSLHLNVTGPDLVARIFKDENQNYGLYQKHWNPLHDVKIISNNLIIYRNRTVRFLPKILIVSTRNYKQNLWNFWCVKFNSLRIKLRFFRGNIATLKCSCVLSSEERCYAWASTFFLVLFR